MRSGFWFSIIVTVIFCAPVLAYDWSTNPGDGSRENPYQISTPEQLISIGSDPSLYNTFKCFALTSDIVFDPNNNPSHVFGQPVIPLFNGSLDGRGFAIENLKITVSTYNNEPVGLIGTYGDHGACRIENLNIFNAEITVGDSFRKVGILCGLNELYIHNCQVSGTIICGTGTTKIGGICGSNGDVLIAGIITHCQSDISISSSSATGTIGECGGICGYNSGTIAHCSAGGEINARNLSLIGGICGYQEYGKIVSCSTSLNITAQRTLYYSGGLCGRNSNGTISHSSATGKMTSAGSSYYGRDVIYYVGGFCGHNTGGLIQSCYSIGDIACSSVELGQGEETGGFCGRNSALGEILDCFSTGDVICGPITGSVPYRERWVGGFCGTNDASIMNCYSTGAVDTDATNKAGFCFMNYRTIEDCFWDTDASGILTAGSSGTIPGVTGKTTEQMQEENTFLNAGWDFVNETTNGMDDIWAITSNLYPSIYRESYNGGNGSPQDPFRISSAQGLIALGKHEEDYYDYFILTEDIDLAGFIFDNAVIAKDGGVSANMFGGTPFYGYLNGQGYSIDDLTIQSNAVEKEYIGLFGAIGQSAEVRNLGLRNVSILGSDMILVGGICGLNTGGTIKRCSVSGNIQGELRVGGISGSNEGYIYDSYVSGNIAASNTVGGICGLLGAAYGGWGHLERCYSTVSVHSDSIYKGGLVGFVGGTAFMKNCFWDTTASGLTSGYYLPPQFWGIIENVQGYTTSQMKQQASFVGWDFLGEDINGGNEIWRMCTDGVDYPRLSWEFARNGDFACGDGVDMLDLQALAEEWLTAADTTPATFNYACDANGDEKINLADYARLAENW